MLFEIGKPGPGMFVLLRGGIEIVTRDGHHQEVPIVTHTERGHFMGELGQLAGRPAFVEGVRWARRRRSSSRRSACARC